MSCKSLLVIAALMFATVRATASASSLAAPQMTAANAVAAPLPAAPEVLTPPAYAPTVAPPAPAAYTMTIYNGARAVQKNWVPENGSWSSYRVFPDCPRPCGAVAPACAAQAPCVRQHCS